MVRYKSLKFLGYPKHRVGSDGTIWRWSSYDQKGFGRRWRWREIGQSQNRINGYKFVLLSFNNRKKNLLVHRVVLLAFVGPCPKGCETRHFPHQDPTDNRLENLSWASKSVNQRDRIVNGTTVRGTNNWQCKLSEDDVRRIRHLREVKGWTYKRIAAKYGMSIGAVSLIVYRRNWSHVE